MKPSELGILQRQKALFCAGCLILAMAMPVLSGCAISRKAEPNPADQEALGTRKHTVLRLAEGRQGFVITEVARLDEAARRDFQDAADLLENGYYDQAVDLLEKVVEHSPGVTAPYINLAIAYRRLDKPDQAEVHLKTALDLVPGHPVACNEYGLLYRETGRFGDARAVYEKALARFPEYYPMHRNLGILCDLYLNDLECALEHYEIYSLIRPEDEKVQLWITDLRMRIGSR